MAGQAISAFDSIERWMRTTEDALSRANREHNYEIPGDVIRSLIKLFLGDDQPVLYIDGRKVAPRDIPENQKYRYLGIKEPNIDDVFYVGDFCIISLCCFCFRTFNGDDRRELSWDDTLHIGIR